MVRFFSRLLELCTILESYKKITVAHDRGSYFLKEESLCLKLIYEFEIDPKCVYGRPCKIQIKVLTSFNFSFMLYLFCKFMYSPLLLHYHSIFLLSLSNSVCLPLFQFLPLSICLLSASPLIYLSVKLNVLLSACLSLCL